MKKLILIAFALTAFTFAGVGVDPYDPDTYKPAPVGSDPYDPYR